MALPEVRRRLGYTTYEQAITADPGDWMLQRNSGMALVGLGLFGKARPYLERALAVIPDDADTLFALAKADQTLGDPAAAARHYAALRVLEPAYPGLPPP